MFNASCLLRARKVQPLSLFRTLLLLLCAAIAAVAIPASAFARPGHDAVRPSRPAGEAARLAWNDRPRDQDRAYIQKQRGNSMPLPQIEQRVIPRMGGADYLGPEMRGGTRDMLLTLIRNK